jgi:single-strand DNA-binding protein
VYIEGRMNSRKYTDKDGVERTAWEVTATDMQFLEPKGAGGSGGGSSYGDEMGADDVPF